MTSGTIVCGVTASPDGRSAAELAHALAARLGLRLVLVSVVDGIPPGTSDSLTARQGLSGAERAIRNIADEIGNGVEKHVVVGARAEAIAQVAADEGADLIVVGSRSSGLGKRKLRCTLVGELEATTPVPVLIAPPSTRKRSGRRLTVATDATAR
jgi:nucleotide-binding universal stress UspA family protein